MRTSSTCAATELFIIADDGKLAAWKKKERLLLCEKSVVPESHDKTTQREFSTVRNDRYLSQKRNVPRVRAEPAAKPEEPEK